MTAVANYVKMLNCGLKCQFVKKKTSSFFVPFTEVYSKPNFITQLN